MIAKGLLILLLFFTATVAASGADNTPEYTMQCEGIERTYRLHIPEHMPENGPLVVVLHGYGNPRPGVFNETADRHLFAACYPVGEKDSGGWGEYLPVPLAVHFCVAKNRCTVMQTDTIIGKAPNRRQIVRHRFSGGLNGSEVWLYEVIGAGHSWFWEDMDTGEELWSFFSRFMEKRDKR